MREEVRLVDHIDLTIEATTQENRARRLEVWGLLSADRPVKPTVDQPSNATAGRTIGGTAAHVPPPRGSTAPSVSDRTVSGAVPVRPTVDQPSTAVAGSTTEGGDVLFATQYIGFVNDRDVMRIGEVGKFDRVRLRVLENDIHINELKIVYGNDETDTLTINADIPKNSRTNWIDLKGDRFIKEIQMVYHSKPSFRGQARIEVFGQYAGNWLSPTGEGRKYNQGWVLLGAQTQASSALTRTPSL